MSRAVDEINRLDGIVPVTPQAVAELIAEIKQLRADNARLRTALQDIAEDPYAVDGGAAEIARAALEPKP